MEGNIGNYDLVGGLDKGGFSGDSSLRFRAIVVGSQMQDGPGSRRGRSAVLKTRAM
jgi:hypothetical protein